MRPASSRRRDPLVRLSANPGDPVEVQLWVETRDPATADKVQGLIERSVNLSQNSPISSNCFRPSLHW